MAISLFLGKKNSCSYLGRRLSSLVTNFEPSPTPLAKILPRAEKRHYALRYENNYSIIYTYILRFSYTHNFVIFNFYSFLLTCIV